MANGADLGREQAIFDEKIAAFLRTGEDCGDCAHILHAPLIVSLTSYPARIPTLHYTLYTLFVQDLKPSGIVLYLSEDEFCNKEGDLPKSVLDFKAFGLQIKWCKGNLYGYKKLIYALKDFADSIIVSADDDNLYPTDWLSKLYVAYETNAHFIHCHRAHRITFDKYNHILPYQKWELDVDFIQSVPSFLNLQTGVGGVLYPPHCLYRDIFKQELFLSLCPFGDDLWFWAMAVLNDVKINIVEHNAKMHKSFIDFARTGALWVENAKGRNDIYLSNLFKHYPLLREKITFNVQEYWEIRYKSFKTLGGGGIGASGAGSYNHLADFKARVLNTFVQEHNIARVLEWGCGDGNQLSLCAYPQYIGLDVSSFVIQRLREKFRQDNTKAFYEVEYFLQNQAQMPFTSADLSLSLDVIYHLIDDRIYAAYMRNLFAFSHQFVIIYASNVDAPHTAHVRHRAFSKWIAAHISGWELIESIPNAYPYDAQNPQNTSFADFYIYKKI
ncbi:methyltransferase domain-containing protein [Helicobacter jaachi]|nr:class I SAM-dependent methyltransferase [Helicobacter jaachi]